MPTRPATSDDLVLAEAERDLYRRIDLHHTHTAQSFASDILPAVPLYPLTHIGCSGACADTGECECSHKTAPRRPRQPRHRPSLWARLWAFLTAARFS